MSIIRPIAPVPVEFVEKTHQYFVDGKKVKTSVTKFISQFFPKFDAYEKAKREVERGERSKYYPMTFGQIMDLWDENGKQAIEEGKQLHSMIERHTKKTLRADEYSIAFAHYLNWLTTNNYNPIESEYVIYDSEFDIAGGVDGIYEREGLLYLIDFKRIENIDTIDKYEHRTAFAPIEELQNCNGEKYFLQLNLYKYILEKYYGVSISGMQLLCLHPNNTSFVQVVVPDRLPQLKKMLGTLQEPTHGWDGNPLTKVD